MTTWMLSSSHAQPQPKALNILPGEDIPKFQVSWHRNNTEITHSAVFSYAKNEHSKIMNGSIITRFNNSTTKSEVSLREVDEDLRNRNVYLIYKPCQQIETNSGIAFLGVSISTKPGIVKRWLTISGSPSKSNRCKRTREQFQKSTTAISSGLIMRSSNHAHLQCHGKD